MSLLTRPRRVRIALARPVVLAALALIVVGALLLIDRATLDSRRQHWMDRCESAGGSVRLADAPPWNPLLTQSDDPTYVCRAPNGRILNRWR